MPRPVLPPMELALTVLTQATALYKSGEFELADAQNLKNELVRIQEKFESDQTDFMNFRVKHAHVSESSMQGFLNNACETALGDFYFESAQRLVESSLRFSNLSPEAAKGKASVPSLYEAIIRRIEQSGFQADVTDLEPLLNVAGQQLVALLVEGELWPVLVIDGDSVPVAGQPTGPDRNISPDVVVRMRDEAQRIGRARNAILEQCEPAVAMAAIISNLVTWLPFRIRQEPPPAAGSASSAGGNAGTGSTLSQGAGGSYSASLMATSIAGGYSPNFGVDTSGDPNCSIASSIALVVCFSHFGGPKTPVRGYLTGGNYLFEATAPDGSTYVTPHKVKVPDRDPLVLPFPP